MARDFSRAILAIGRLLNPLWHFLTSDHLVVFVDWSVQLCRFPVNLDHPLAGLLQVGMVEKACNCLPAIQRDLHEAILCSDNRFNQDSSHNSLSRFSNQPLIRVYGKCRGGVKLQRTRSPAIF